VKLSESDVTALAAAEEIRIETRGSDGATHRTIIWVVEHDGDVYLRSVNGPGARWYREATANGSAELEVDGRSIPVRLEPAADEAGIAACSAGLERKYRGDYSLASMLEPKTLPTTLRVVPA
jgi:hypothetical protein